MEKSTTSKLANSTFTSHFFSSQSTQQSCLVPIKNNRVDMLHSLLTLDMLTPKNPTEKPLLLHAAFHNSSASALYLLRRGAKLNTQDNQAKSVFHICAYTGHIDVLKAIRNQMKLIRIKELNKQYISLLNANNYKRTDVKQGKLKISVSETRKKSFEKMQESITTLYKNYVFTLLQDTFSCFTARVKTTNRNCFHLASLNRYQRCYNTMEFMFEELSQYKPQLDISTIQLYNQVNNCFHNEEDKMDPRLFEDTLELIEETILPNKLQDIRKSISKQVEEYIQSILSAKDKDGHTPLYISSKDGSTAIINLIRKWGTQKTKQSEDKEDLIKVANHNLARSHIMDLCDASKEADSKTMNFLLSCGEEINKKKTIFGTFALLQAVKSFQKERNIQPIRLLILSGADINEQDTNGWTVLHHACERGHKQILQQIFKIWQQGKTKKISINKLTNKNYHILHLSAMSNHSQIIEYLLTSPSPKKLDLNTNAVDTDRCTMLHHAARKGSVEALKKILDISPELIYELDIRSNTALHYAAMSDHTACIKYLLYFDSDFDKLHSMQNSRGKSARDLTVNKKPFESIFSAARAGNVNQVRKMISETPNLKKITTPTKERTLLILAVLNQHLLVVKYLVEQGVDQTHKDKSGKNARDYASQCQKNSKTKQDQVVAKNIASLFS